MRAVKTNAFLWAALVVVVGFNEHLALWAGVIGLLLAIVPALTAPRLEPVANHENGAHAGTLYRLNHPANPNPPQNPTR